MKTIIKPILLSLGLLAGAFTAQAQVKIGDNPTTIGATSNLEVEATNSKKVIVNKDVGTVVIENTPPGATTDKIVTVDLAGNVRAIDGVLLRDLLGLSGSGSMSRTTGQSLPNGGHTVVDFTTLLGDDLGSIDLVNNEFVVKKAGTYSFSSTVQVGIPGTTGRANVDAFIEKWDGTNWIFVGAAQGEQNAGSYTIITISVTDNFVVGDRLRLMLVPCLNCIAGNLYYTLQNAKFFGVKNY